MSDRKPAPQPPASTYRLQLHRDFGFRDAERVLPYLASLGVTHLYLSPYLAARTGSTHGYDICDHTELNPELGGAEGFEALTDELRRRGMGHVLDFVPNHMGIEPSTNRWWRDVLENGPSSPYARYFDVDWDAVKPEIRKKVLLPTLGDAYGIVLERGELRLEYRDGRLHLRYFEHDLPINPRQAPRLLRHGLERLESELGPDDPSFREYVSIVTALGNLPPYTDDSPERVSERQREKEVARERLLRLTAADPRILRHVEENVATFNGQPGDPSSFDLLHDLLEAQAYRLAYWRTAFHEINYRRFFDINDLAALRMEDPQVFAATHALVIERIREGRIDGLRIDHLDGLFDPGAYLDRLREQVGPVYVVAEKILSAGEALPRGWPIDGTSGYDFLNDVNGLFVEPSAAAPMRRFYGRFSRRQAPFEIVAYVSKKLITQTSLASELNVLAHALNRISEGDRRSRDFTLESLREALREVVACFPVYRTYVSSSGASDSDRRIVDTAIARAQRRNPTMEPSILRFVRDVLLPEADHLAADERGRRLDLSMKFQQYTGPVQAKGLEDTAFYRYNVLLALNEVGGDPQRFGRTPEEFHEASRRRRAEWRHALLATATHDTKRGEDARLRIALLSEIFPEWRQAVVAWSKLNARGRTRMNGDWAPDRNEEYLLYQTLIGVWPADDGEDAAASLVERLQAYLRKALREAKLHTSWTNVDERYEEAVMHFVERILVGPTAARFLDSFRPFQRRVAQIGAAHSLSQLLLKMTSPGIPDVYQGTELWDLSLVDPDNRRPVDYGARQGLLAELEPCLDERSPSDEREKAVAAMLEAWPDGRIKLFLTAALLRLRRAMPEVFLEGDYRPLPVQGTHAGRVIAFARTRGEVSVVAVAPRLVSRLLGPGRRWPVGRHAWGDTRLALPADLAVRPLESVLTGGALPAAQAVAVADLLAVAPVGVFRSG